MRPSFSISEILGLKLVFVAEFMCDLVRTPKNRFSHDAVQLNAV